MRDETGSRVARWLFGEEGEVVTATSMQIVMATSAISVAGLFVVSPIVSVLAGEFNVGAGTAGQVMTVFTAPSILIVPVAGAVADRIGRKPPLTAGLVLFGLGGAAIAAAPTFQVVLALRFVQGIGYAMTIPISVAILGDLYRGTQEATAQGLRIASIQFVSITMPPLSSVLAIAAWQYPFLLYLLALGVAAWAWVALPPGGSGSRTRSLPAYLADLGASLRRPAMAALLATFAVRFALTTAFLTYVSVLLSSAPAYVSGTAIMGYGGVALVASSQAGRTTVAYDGSTVLLVAMALTGVGLAVLPAGTIGLATGVLLLGGGSGLSAAVQKSLVTSMSRESLRAGAVSSAIMFQSIGQTLAPLVMGLLLLRYATPITFVAFGAIGGALGVIAAAVTWTVDP